jgi:alpha-L-rhamnosidase
MVQIDKVTCEHYASPLGIHHTRPRLSWRFKGEDEDRDWSQQSYDVQLRFLHHDDESTDDGVEEYHVDSNQSVLVPWFTRDLVSRDRVHIRIRSNGNNNASTSWAEITIEVALLSSSEWKSKLISGPPQPESEPHRPILLRKKFTLPPSTTATTRLYITAHGCYKAFINGKPVAADLFTPGWQSYHHRSHYQTFDVGHLLDPRGQNVLALVLGEGWFSTRLNFGGGRRNIWGKDLGVLLQLESRGEVVLKSEKEGWEWGYGPILKSEIYDGEVYDGTLETPGWNSLEGPDDSSWNPDVREIGFPRGRLVPQECPPVRVTQEIKPVQIITTPSGKKILDFGQNLVGWLKFATHPVHAKRGDRLVISHAEVLEDGELGTRPLRHAKAQIHLTVGPGSLKGWTPSFTFHGFRYALVEGWEGVDLDCLTAQVIHTDMERVGWFECDHALINKVWENVNWSLRGNFLSVPTDCPQRDERLGWTGDLQTFAETAGFLFDTASSIGSWLEDLAEEQIKDWNGIVPLVVPNTLGDMFGPPPPSAIWGDVAVLTPRDLYTAFGDKEMIVRQYESIKTWIDRGIKRNDRGLWDGSLPQFGDWLDPKAPPEAPQDGRTDSLLVADAWLVQTTRAGAELAGLIGEREDAGRWTRQAERLREEWIGEYVTPNGRIMSDTQTALVIALHFGLLPEELVPKVKERLDFLVRKAIFQISTGFAGTPIILHALSENGLLQHAYRMFQEKEYPSLLYPASMGATTVVSILHTRIVGSVWLINR